MTNIPEQSLDKKVDITAVIVLYQRSFLESDAFLTLQKAHLAAGEIGLTLHILLYDNTPDTRKIPVLPDGVEYKAALENRGLASAYNWAIERAEEYGSSWLLTLDQDTDLPVDFLLNMSAIASAVAETPMIAAIVPQIVEKDRILSPYYFAYGAISSWYSAGFFGVPKQAVFAFNSAALIRVSALKQVGGYHPWFWLDNSDAFLFRQLQRYGKRVFVAGNIKVGHEFSMLDMRNRISPGRYRNVLLAETAFWDLEMNLAAAGERTARLLFRLYKHFRRKDPMELRLITKEFLFRRLFWSKTRRLQSWKEESLALFPFLPPFSRRVLRVGKSDTEFRNDLTNNIRISVCLAAYNKGPHVGQQLRSILPQLGAGDEIVIVDDASTDDTLDVIQTLLASTSPSPMIRLLRHERKQGIAATFEEALRNATGELLFLANGEGVWAKDKVDLFIRAFQQNPEVNIITSGVALTYSYGESIESDRSIKRSHFQGSAMAIRALLLGSLLPFPSKTVFAPEQWMERRSVRSLTQPSS